MEPIWKPVDFFRNADGDFVNYILECPLKKRQFKGGPNKGTFYAAPSDCDNCRYKLDTKYRGKLMAGGIVESPFHESILCDGNNAPTLKG